MPNNSNETKKETKRKIINDMPHSPDAERALLGCLLINPKIQAEVAPFITEDMFYNEAHKYIFNAMETLIKANKTVDLVTLTDTLEKQGTIEKAGGIIFISSLADILPSSANYSRYLEIVIRDNMLRNLIKGSAEIIENCQSSSDEKESLAFAEKTVYDISNTADTSKVVKIGNILPEVMLKLDELSKDKSSVHGIKTGFKGLDNILNGLHKSDLIVLAARPGVGKTSLSMNIVENVALQGKSCMVFSLEMGKEQLGQRMLCSVAGVSMEHALKGQMDKQEWLKIAKAKKVLSDASIFIDDSAIITPQAALSQCRRIKRKFGLDLVMVDYIQLMSSLNAKKSDSRQNEITEISRNLKILAKELEVPVIALSQLSRSSEKEKRRPQLSDLRESGAIEQDADIVMFIHRPDKGATESEIAEGKVQKNVAELIVEKHRNGPQGMVKLYFKGECTKFVNIDNETGEPEIEDNIKSSNTKPSEEVFANPEIEKSEFLKDVREDESLTPPPENLDDEIF